MTSTQAIDRVKRRRRVIVVGVALSLCAWLSAGWVVIALVTAPQPRSIESIESLAGVTVSDELVIASDGVELRAWLAQTSGRRAVLLFAGFGGNRTSLLGLAEHYLARGWSVLLPDLRGTGTSGGDRIGFGYLERLDVLAWIQFVRARGFHEIGLHGQSLGAAAVAYSLAEADHESLRFVVLESCYDDVRNALANRLPWLPFPSLALKPVEWFGAASVDADVGLLRPVDHIRSLDAPVLFIAGDLDRKVLPTETERLFEACGSTRKQLHWVRGAGHTALWSYNPKDYASAFDAFLDELAAQPAGDADGPSGRG